MSRCQVQYLYRCAWVSCRNKAVATLAVAEVERQLCADHRDEVRRAQAAGLEDGLRWSDRPSPRRRHPGVGQLQLVDVPATPKRRRGGRSA